MLPETLLCLLNVVLVLAQTQQLALNVVSSFTSSNIPNPPLFTLPPSDNLSVSVALCSETSPPRFFVSNSSSTPQESEITIIDGHGTWTGHVGSGAILYVEAAPGQSSFELAVSEDGAFLIMLPPRIIIDFHHRSNT